MFDGMPATAATERYAKCIEISKRVNWEIDRDVIRGRRFDLAHKYLPDGLSLIGEFDLLTEAEKRFMSQIQGRTYANVFGLVERFINAKILELSADHWLGDQVALEALIGFSKEELKHQALFRKIEQMVGETMPAGYDFAPNPDEVARAVLGARTWAVLALTLDIELFTQKHYRESIDADPTLSPLYKDVFLFHWKEESQHAIMDELELRREDAKLSAEERDAAVDDFIALVGAVDGILQAQAEADAKYFVATARRAFSPAETDLIRRKVLKAYRWQYIFSGAEHPHFQKVMTELVTPAQMEHIGAALSQLA
jgi:hypothetical protein